MYLQYVGKEVGSDGHDNSDKSCRLDKGKISCVGCADKEQSHPIP